MIVGLLVMVQVGACTSGERSGRARPVAETWSAAQTQPESTQTQPAVATEQQTSAQTQPAVVTEKETSAQVQPAPTPAPPTVAQEQPVSVQAQPTSAPTQLAVAKTQPVAARKQSAPPKVQPAAAQVKPTSEPSQAIEPTVTASVSQAKVTAPDSQPTATAPASQPASKIVLVRIGDRAVVTQADFEAAIYGAPEGYHKGRQRSMMTYLTHRRLFDVYVEDHNLISDQELDTRIKRDLKAFKVASLDELKQKLQQAGLTLDDHRRATRSAMAEAAMSEQGIEQGKDEAYLKELFDTRRDEFDGTYVEARHIMLAGAPYETPAEKEAKRQRLVQMREDIESGKRTWEECVAESDSRVRQGSLGGFTRHFMKNEFLSAVAFDLKGDELSDVSETPLGYHLLQVTKRVPGTRSFEESERDIRRWLQQEAYVNAIAEVTAKYPVIGIQPPKEPTRLGPPPKPRLRMPRLKTQRKPATKPATPAASRPAPARKAR